MVKDKLVNFKLFYLSGKWPFKVFYFVPLPSTVMVGAMFIISALLYKRTITSSKCPVSLYFNPVVKGLESA